MRTGKSSIAAIAALAAMLFAQAAIALASCDIGRGEVLPMPMHTGAAHEPQAAPCHESPAENSNLCFAHCLNNDQSLDKQQIKVPAAAAAPALVAHAYVVPLPDGRPLSSLRVAALPAGPPPRILFQSFLI